MTDPLDDAIRAAAAEIVATAPPVTASPVAAAAKRRKIPFWAMATLSMMPVFAFIYVRALTSDTAADVGPLSIGAETYSACASCHGPTGEGIAGLGYQLSDGEVLRTFPNIDDQMRYVYYGTDQYNIAGVDVYGDPTRPSGAHVTGARSRMPGFGGQLSNEEIVAVVCHERYTLGGADPENDEYSAEYNAWCADDAPVFNAVAADDVDLTSSEPPPPFDSTDEDYPIVLVGPEPIPGRQP